MWYNTFFIGITTGSKHQTQWEARVKGISIKIYDIFLQQIIWRKGHSRKVYKLIWSILFPNTFKIILTFFGLLLCGLFYLNNTFHLYYSKWLTFIWVFTGNSIILYYVFIVPIDLPLEVFFTFSLSYLSFNRWSGRDKSISVHSPAVFYLRVCPSWSSKSEMCAKSEEPFQELRKPSSRKLIHENWWNCEFEKIVGPAGF